jgi:glyoxylate/hydroxypyruvate reductase A
MAVLHIHPGADVDIWRRSLGQYLPGLDLRSWPNGIGDRAEIEVVLAWKPPPGELATYPNLKAVLSLGAGVDHIVSDPAFPAGVIIGRLVDPGLVQDMVQYVAHWALSFHRGFHTVAERQEMRTWNKFFYPPAADRRVGVMGLGALGSAAALHLAGMGFDVAGWTRTPKAFEGIVSFHGDDGLLPFLQRSEIVVGVLPHTKETENLLDSRAFDAMPVGGFLINAGRGALVVDADLVAALESGHIAGAALDVFRREPLPADHPFWECPNTFITCHSASLTKAEGGAPFIAEDIRRVLAGQPPLHSVDPARAY